MIPVTFIVGAGASQVHKLPTGFELKTRAVQSLKPNTDLFRLIRFALKSRDQKYDDGYLSRFRELLDSHPGHSIDELLEDQRRDKDVVTVGKAVIAGFLGHSLMKAVNDPVPSEDWLREIVNIMRVGAGSPDAFVAKNIQTRFVTFNFDTFIDRRLPSFVPRLYGASTSANKFLPVVHVHGELEGIPSGPFMFDPTSINSIWVNWITASIDRISVTSDAIDQNVLDEARKAISDASIVCFLGFSYNDVNVIDRLGLPKTLKDGAEVFGSAKGLTESKIQRISQLFSPVVIRLADSTCREVFDKYHILR